MLAELSEYQESREILQRLNQKHEKKCIRIWVVAAQIEEKNGKDKIQKIIHRGLKSTLLNDQHDNLREWVISSISSFELYPKTSLQIIRAIIKSVDERQLGLENLKEILWEHVQESGFIYMLVEEVISSKEDS